MSYFMLHFREILILAAFAVGLLMMFAAAVMALFEWVRLGPNGPPPLLTEGRQKRVLKEHRDTPRPAVAPPAPQPARGGLVTPRKHIVGERGPEFILPPKNYQRRRT